MQHEFQPGLSLLCCSDPEPVTLQDLLSMTKEIGDDELLKKYNNMSLAYTESKGDPELRALIAANMYGTLTEDELITMVPEEGIFLTMMAAINEGDDVVVMSPGYQSLSEVARSSGANVVNWEPRIIDNDSGDTTIAFDVCDLKRLIAEECRSPPKMIVVNFPHNPTGTKTVWTQVPIFPFLRRDDIICWWKTRHLNQYAYKNLQIDINVDAIYISQ